MAGLQQRYGILRTFPAQGNPWLPTRFLFVLPVLASALAGCSQKIDIYLGSNEQWRIVTEFSCASLAIDELLVNLLLEEILPLDDFPTDIIDSPSDFVVRAILEELVAVYNQQGIMMEWRRGGFFRHQQCRIELSATGYDRLERVLPPGHIVVNRTDDAVALYIHLSEVNPAVAWGFQQEITLHGARILEANTPYARKRSATWYNPAYIQAMVRPQQGLDTEVIILIVGLASALVLTAFGVVRLSQQRRRKEATLDFSLGEYDSYDDDLYEGFEM